MAVPSSGPAQPKAPAPPLQPNATATRICSAVYKPFGEQTETLSPANLTPESKGWIGERYDADAGLQYLNARYYDPSLGIFLQPDWFEVLKPGVGTNRFSYSFNDPVNKLDPMGNYSWKEFKKDVGSFFSGFASGFSANASLENTVNHAAAGASAGVIVGSTAGMTVGCAASACTVSVATTPAGALTGGLLGTLLGLGSGGALDAHNAISGGVVGGVTSVQQDRVLSNSDDETRDKPPPGSRPIDRSPWSGNHEEIKEGILAGPDDDVKIDREGNVWAENPNGSWTNHGPAADYTGSGKAEGRWGYERDSRRYRPRDLE